MSRIEELHLLNELLIKSLTTRFKLDLESEAGFLPTDAATMNAAIALLRFNNITADPKSADDLNELRDRLRESQKARKGTGSNVVELAEGNLAKLREKL